MAKFVAVYAVCRNYGGPEEGGWYYDRTYRIAVRRVRSAGKARQLAQRLHREFPQSDGKRYSVRDDTDHYIRVHSDPSKIWRDESRDPRPHYE